MRNLLFQIVEEEDGNLGELMMDNGQKLPNMQMTLQAFQWFAELLHGLLRTM